MAERNSRIRIVGGSLGGRRITVPGGDSVRPTTDRVREAMFNALSSVRFDDGSLDHGSTVVDLFAGSGALGIEALSRGFERAIFVERQRSTAQSLTATIAELGLGPRSTVLTADAMSVLGSSPIRGCGLMFCDPPYEFDRWAELLAKVSAQLVVVESPLSGDELLMLTDRFEVRRTRKYGRTSVTFLVPAHAAT